MLKTSTPATAGIRAAIVAERNMALNKWDERFFSVARLASEWSKDPKAKVGAVVVDAQGQIAGVGYNGFPKLVEDSAERYADDDTKLEMVVHAEENAILGAGPRARGGSIYVFGKPVCARCAGTIIQAGVRCVVAQEPKEGTNSKWDKSGRTSCKMLNEARIEFVPTSN
jgi:dCMP deaminase